ncbi:MAG: pilus assembly protein [Acidimicrobiia bacterium]|nr:pilus assembly protein [Acidimicrobiia bacterium]
MSAPDTTTPPARQARRRRDERGATLVEMALVLPLFLTLVFGIIEFGFYFAQANQVRYAAREAARVAGVDGDFATVEAAVCGNLTLVGSASYTVDVAPGENGGRGQVNVNATYVPLVDFLDLPLADFNSQHDFFVEPDQTLPAMGQSC